MSSERWAALVTWFSAVGFGVPVIPVGVYLLRRGTLPTFFGLFEMYGGPWSSRLRPRPFVMLLVAFLLVLVVVAWSAWLVWRSSKAGALVGLALLPVEAVFWIGFALPLPWVLGAARAVLLAMAWRSLH